MHGSSAVARCIVSMQIVHSKHFSIAFSRAPASSLPPLCWALASSRISSTANCSPPAAIATTSPLRNV
ncbi:hypothetical protein T484DRAFT_1984923 [Baffinella frigidus]|nr:hypothetical protein T484DRAFT_1984923 [Cryptophyta sp. CCMP2293]